MSALSEIKEQIKEGSLPLSKALAAVRELAKVRLTEDESRWLENELNGYVVSETLPREVSKDVKDIVPSGFTLDAEKAATEAELPDYRKLYGKTLATNPATGNEADFSNTAFGKMPNLVIENIEYIEKNLLPLIEQNKPAGTITYVGGIETTRVIPPAELQKLFDGITARLCELIDRVESA